MYVDGALVPRSTTKMPRKDSMLKSRVKIKQKTWRRRSGTKKLSILPSGLYPPFSNGNIRSERSHCLSEYHPRKHARHRKSNPSKTKQYSRRPKTSRWDFHNGPDPSGTFECSSFESSISDTFLSNGHNCSFHNHIYSYPEPTFWRIKKNKELVRNQPHGHQYLFGSPNHFSGLIGIDSFFKSRYH